MNDPTTTPQLPLSCSIAFKEWAVVCEALASGRQSVILRKGGIHEGREGFRVQHSTFWLYPTNFHQEPEHLSADAGGFLDEANRRRPPPGTVQLREFALVDQAIHLTREAQVQSLQGLHLWSDTTVHERFHYRQPGLFLLVVRIFQRDAPHVVQELPEMAGCKSWVELPEPLTTSGLKPVLSDEDFAERRSAVLGAIAKTQA